MSARYTENNLGEIPDECVICISEFLERTEVPSLRVINKRLYDNLRACTYLRLTEYFSKKFMTLPSFRKAVFGRVSDPKMQVGLRLRFLDSRSPATRYHNRYIYADPIKHYDWQRYTVRHAQRELHDVSMRCSKLEWISEDGPKKWPSTVTIENLFYHRDFYQHELENLFWDDREYICIDLTGDD